MVAVSVGAVLVMVIIFMAGVKFGSERAMFFSKMNVNYERNFLGERGGSWRELSGKNAIGMHGIVGQVIGVGSSSISVMDRDGLEKSVEVTASTSMRSARENISLIDIKVNQNIIVFGKPNELGQIEATMIRFAPENMPGFGQRDNKRGR